MSSSESDSTGLVSTPSVSTVDLTKMSISSSHSNSPSPDSAVPDSAPPKMIVLHASDGKTFEVEEFVALKSKTIEKMIQDNGGSDNIKLPKVTSEILALVIKYLQRHAKAEIDASESKTVPVNDSNKEQKEFDAELLKVDQKTLFEVILAADYLGLDGLLDCACQNLADMIKNKTPAEIREIFSIKNDYTEEEEKLILQETEWAYL